MKVDLISHKTEVLSAFDIQCAKAMEMVAMQAEANAKIEITKAVYDTPERGYVRTGNLRNSISSDSDDDSAVIGTNVEYAPFVEFGTCKMRARPYLRPAAANYVDEYKAIVKSCLQNG